MKKEPYVFDEQDETDIKRVMAQDYTLGNPLIAARYSKSADAIVFDFQNGLQMRVPRRLLQGLAEVAPGSAVLNRMTILGPGSGIAWDDIDIAFNVETLLEGLDVAISRACRQDKDSPQGRFVP